MNQQLSIDFSAVAMLEDFDGATYDAAQDKARLHTQLRDVKELMRDGVWRSLHAISDELGYPEASVSARLRDCRKMRFGGHLIQRQRAKDGKGTFLYRMVL